MQTRIRWHNAARVAVLAALAGILWWSKAWLWQAAGQLFRAMVLSLIALPAAKRLEKRMGTGISSALALAGVLLVLTGLVMLFAPPLIRQGRELGALLPGLYDPLVRMAERLQGILGRIGLVWEDGVRDTLLHKGQELLGSALPAAVGWLSGVAGSIGKWMLVPVFSFYFLRDRKQIGNWLATLLPVGLRRLTVRIVREMKRETAGYLRGQLMACAVVGALTAAGLFCCGVPSWLFLGFAMGVLEFIPYAGPFAGGVLAVLFALPGGTARTLWTLGVVVAVQQLEGMVLSPKLMSDATRLHPLAVVLCVTAGGAAAGFSGVLLAVPLVLCIRAALRVISLRRFDQ